MRRIEAIEPWASPAVTHAWQHVEPHPVALLWSHFIEHGFVVADRVFRSNGWIGPAVINQELAAASLKLRKIRIDCIDETQLLIEQRHITVHVEGRPV